MRSRMLDRTFDCGCRQHFKSIWSVWASRLLLLRTSVLIAMKTSYMRRSTSAFMSEQGLTLVVPGVSPQTNGICPQTKGTPLVSQKRPKMEAEAAELERQSAAIVVPPPASAESYKKLRIEIAALEKLIMAEVLRPERCLLFMRPGRLIQVRKRFQDVDTRDVHAQCLTDRF